MPPAAAQNALKHYATVGVQSEAEVADPHRVIQMLFEGVLSRLSVAAFAMREGQIAKKGENIGLAISILGGLQASLDHDQGGEIAANLERLYEYAARTLVEANLENDVDKIDHVHGLLADIKSGWDEIAPSR